MMMKVTRRIVTILLAVGMILSFPACGSSEKSVTLQFTEAQWGGITSTQTITLYAKDDTVQKVEAYYDVEYILSDVSDAGDIAVANEQYKATIDWMNVMVDTYNTIDGCVASAREVGNSYRLTLTVDCTGGALSVLRAHDLMELEDSLEANLVQMEEDGYTLVE